MSKLPSFRRIYEQDYPEENQELIRILSVSVNAGFEQLFDAINGKLTIEDNLASKVKSFQLQVSASGTPTSKTIIKKPTSDKINGMSVIKVTNLTDLTVYPTTCPFISYTETVDTIIVNNITGLSPNYLYEVNVELLR